MENRERYGTQVNELKLRIDAIVNMAEAHIQSAYDLVELLEQAAYEVEPTSEERQISREEAQALGLEEALEIKYALHNRLRGLVGSIKTAGQGKRPERS